MITYESIFFWTGLVWGVASCALLIAAWAAVVSDKERFEALHRRLMLIMAAGGWSFVLLYLAGALLRTAPRTLSPGLIPWIAVHGTVSLLTLIGVTLLAWARLTAEDGVEAAGLRGHLNGRHTSYGRVLALLWLFGHVGGIVNLYLTG